MDKLTVDQSFSSQLPQYSLCFIFIGRHIENIRVCGFYQIWCAYVVSGIIMSDDIYYVYSRTERC